MSKESKSAEEVVAALRKITGAKIGVWHYMSWLEGKDGYDTFDALVKKFLGKEAYEEMDSLARLDAYLKYRLGIGPDNAGGVVFAPVKETCICNPKRSDQMAHLPNCPESPGGNILPLRKRKLKTKINSVEKEWTQDIRDLWEKHVAPKMKEGEFITSANYYTPRPYVDIYNRGSDKRGFIYILNGRHVCYIELLGEK